MGITEWNWSIWCLLLHKVFGTKEFASYGIQAISIKLFSQVDLNFHQVVQVTTKNSHWNWKRLHIIYWVGIGSRWPGVQVGHLMFFEIVSSYQLIPSIWNLILDASMLVIFKPCKQCSRLNVDSYDVSWGMLGHSPKVKYIDKVLWPQDNSGEIYIRHFA